MSKQPPKMLPTEQWPTEKPIPWLHVATPGFIKTEHPEVYVFLGPVSYSTEGWAYSGKIYRGFSHGSNELLGDGVWSMEGKWLGGWFDDSSGLDSSKLDIVIQATNPNCNQSLRDHGSTVKSSVKFMPVVKEGVLPFDEATTELHQAISDPVERQHVIDYRVFEMAWLGKRGPDQERIAKAGLAWISLLLRKNKDYGNSAWSTPVLTPECSIDTAIRVRMSDKIARIQYLLSGKSPEVAESLRDNIADLGSYCLLLLTIPPAADATAAK